MKKQSVFLCAFFLLLTKAFANDKAIYTGDCEHGYHFHATQELNIESNFMSYYAELTNAEGLVIAHQINGVLPGFLIEKDGTINYNIELTGYGHKYIIKIEKVKSRMIPNHFNTKGMVLEDYNDVKKISCNFLVKDNIHDI